MQQKTFREIFESYVDDLLVVSYSYVKDWGIAEDIVQEVFLHYWETEQQFRGASSLKTYLMRAAINRSKDKLKSWGYRAHVWTNLFVKGRRDAARLIAREEQSAIAEAVFQLPAELRVLIVLYFYQGYTYKEMAAMLETPESTVKFRVKKAKELLAIKLPNERWEVLSDDLVEG